MATEVGTCVQVVREGDEGEHVMREKGLLEKVSEAVGAGSTPDKVAPPSACP